MDNFFAELYGDRVNAEAESQYLTSAFASHGATFHSKEVSNSANTNSKSKETKQQINTEVSNSGNTNSKSKETKQQVNAEQKETNEIQKQTNEIQKQKNDNQKQTNKNEEEQPIDLCLEEKEHQEDKQKEEKEKQEKQKKEEEEKRNYLLDQKRIEEFISVMEWPEKEVIECLSLIQQCKYNNIICRLKVGKNVYGVKINDIARLLGGKWLEGEIIRGIFKKLSEESHFLNFPDTKLKNNYWIVFQDVHFGVLGFNNDLQGVFYDSLPQDNYLEDKKMQFEQKFGMSPIPPKGFPLQNNSIDCGLFSLLCGFLLGEEGKNIVVKRQISTDDMKILRKEIVREILLKKEESKFVLIFKKWIQHLKLDQ